ncbi:MAG: glycosyltransferase [Rhodanobacteraceae bacterium]
MIVPFGLHEAEGAVLLDQLRGLRGGVEIVLVRVDGCSLPMAVKNDGVVVRVCTSAAGRARQMNVGAQAARGRWLWFVHADSRLRARTLPALETFLASNNDALGYFDLRYRDGPTLAHLNALGANLRARWFGLPFGDQGLVLPAAWFARLGGYDEGAGYGEDHLLVWHARQAGLPLRRLAATLESSARKYTEHGWWCTTTRHLRLTVRQAWPEWRASHRRTADAAATHDREAAHDQ